MSKSLPTVESQMPGGKLRRLTNVRREVERQSYMVVAVFIVLVATLFRERLVAFLSSPEQLTLIVVLLSLVLLAALAQIAQLQRKVSALAVLGTHEDGGA